MKQATHFNVQKGWKILITDMGLNPAHVLAMAGLPADLFSLKAARLTPVQYFGLWEAIEELVGGEELPLKVGQVLSVEAFDPPIFASFCSPNLNTALQRLARFKRLIGPWIMSVDIGKRSTRVSMTCYGHDGRIPPSTGAVELVFFTQLARMATRSELATYYLVRSEVSSGEIGYLLGYQDANSFLRAFRSWTGTTPGEYRREHLHLGFKH